MNLRSSVVRASCSLGSLFGTSTYRTSVLSTSAWVSSTCSFSPSTPWNFITVRHATKKAGGTVSSSQDSKGRRLGWKKGAGEVCYVGEILRRQRGTVTHPGVNVGIGKDHTLFAKTKGILVIEYINRPFLRRKKRRQYACILPKGYTREWLRNIYAEKEKDFLLYAKAKNMRIFTGESRDKIENQLLAQGIAPEFDPITPIVENPKLVSMVAERLQSEGKEMLLNKRKSITLKTLDDSSNRTTSTTNNAPIKKWNENRNYSEKFLSKVASKMWGKKYVRQMKTAKTQHEIQLFKKESKLASLNAPSKFEELDRTFKVPLKTFDPSLL